MSLADELGQETTSAVEPKYAPHTEYDGSAGHIQTGPMRADEQPADFTELLEQFGYDPAKVRIVGHPRTSRWQRYDGEWLCAHRFHLAPVGPGSADDLAALVVKARKASRDKTTAGDYWLVFQAGDLQLGKRSSGGSTELIVDTYIRSVEAAKDEYKRLKRHGIAGIQICMPGDCIEGVTSQSSRNIWLTQETVTEQTRILRRLMFHTVETFAPLADVVYLDVVNGNHDDSQRHQNSYPGDGWGTETAIAVSDALKLNPAAFGHVQVRTPDKWKGNMTVSVGDSIVTVVHGHQWRNGKAFDWWASQAVNNQPAGGSQILQSGHWHTWELKTNAERTHIGSPTFDGGSDWLTEKTGAKSKRGALVYLLRSGEISCLSLV